MQIFHHKKSSPYGSIWHELYFTCEMVLMVAPVWRSTFTTLRWPLWDAAIRGVTPFCEGGERTITMMQLQKTTNMDKGKNQIISANKNIVILYLHGHSFTSKYSTQVHFSYTSILPTSLYNNSPPQLYPTGMLLVCSMLNVGVLTCMCTV